MDPIHRPFRFTPQRNLFEMTVGAEEKRTVLIVGCGSIGERHLRCFLGTRRVEAIACEPNQELLNTITERYQVPGCSSLDEGLAREDVSAVVICTPAHLHVQMAIQCLKAGKDVLIEKPLAVSLDGTDELVGARDESGKKVGIAYVQRFNPPITRVSEYVHSGALGKVHQVALRGGQHFPTYRPAYREIYYNDRRTGGGAIQDALTHMVNVMEWMLGPTQTLVCDAAHQSLPGVEVEDTVNIIAQNGEALVSYSINQFQCISENNIELHGEDGSVRIFLHQSRWDSIKRGEVKWTRHEIPEEERDWIFRTQASAFLDMVEEKASILCTLEEGIQTLKFNLAALKSADSGQRVNIER